MKFEILTISILFISMRMAGQGIIQDNPAPGAFPIVSAAKAATIIIDECDDSLVIKSARLFQSDVEAVTGKRPEVENHVRQQPNIILIGNIHKNRFLKQLVREKKLDATSLNGKWEGYLVRVVSNPFPRVASALVIAGSDRRGTAYGMFELSKQMGVSPWYWWADVPVKRKSNIYIRSNTNLTDAPKVKYRGIFINDEAPALSNWSREKFGGFNHKFYEKVFELILRLKGNYLWPAMWGNAFYDDDPKNRETADKYGIVIGTSHHEPLMRAHDEWRRYGKGKWNYDANPKELQRFWREGMQRASNEKIVSIGMRGDGDEPMTEGTAIALLEKNCYRPKKDHLGSHTKTRERNTTAMGAVQRSAGLL